MTAPSPAVAPQDEPLRAPLTDTQLYLRLRELAARREAPDPADAGEMLRVLELLDRQMASQARWIEEATQWLRGVVDFHDCVTVTWDIDLKAARRLLAGPGGSQEPQNSGHD